ncbi:DNA primase subunit [Escherichia phage vB_EcoM_005]|uniref:DNA primase subunit n=1 Tax=Escherichia phage vB_EcoM_005 TaxID=2500761 RepID=A0A3T0ILY9_9CAUD|nr:DNA primase subunit [Escherichia phage vB_EcoM_005]AZV01084.1 DNA primase subunit [Escherichia phage vB_EcoM_005]
MSFVDREFALRAFQTLPKFRQVTGSDFKLNARCPICGDSQKDEHKARFWAYPVNDGGIMLHCFNCDASLGIKKYLYEYEPDLYR